MTTDSTPSPHALPANALTVLHRLNEQRVEYVLIGELAATLHGCPSAEQTVVVVPARFQRNLDRLARALRSLHARGRGPATASADGPALTATGLRALGHWRLSTDFGALDIDFEPPATAGHLDLFENARRLALTPEVEVEVAAAGDLVRIAEMRRGAHDEALLPALRVAYAQAPVSAR